jgi:hypothetical protein
VVVQKSSQRSSVGKSCGSISLVEKSTQGGIVGRKDRDIAQLAKSSAEAGTLEEAYESMSSHVVINTVCGTLPLSVDKLEF